MKTKEQILDGMDYNTFCVISSRDPAFFIERMITDENDEPIILKPFHREWIEMFLKNDRVLIVCATGHGKSFVMGIGIALWLAYFNKNKEILIVSNTEPQAKGLIERMKQQIDNNQMLKELELDNPDTWTKCGWIEQLVDMADGSKKRHGSLEIGDNVLGKDGSVEITGVEDNGIKEVFRIKTYSGRVLYVTGNHPIWTGSGWIQAKDSLGHQVFPSTVKGNSEEVSLDEARLLGYFMGDGSLSSSHCHISNTDEGILSDIEQIASVHGWKSTRKTWSSCPELHLRGGVRKFFSEQGVMNLASGHKKVPNSIFRCSEPIVQQFINGIFDTDGFISDPTTKEGIRIRWAQSSERLSYGIQELLLRIGINARIRKRRAQAQTGGPRDVWIVEITGDEAYKLALKLSSCVPFKQSRINAWRIYPYTKRSGPKPKHDYIVEVVSVGMLPTVAVETKDHTYVTGGIITHNTEMVLKNHNKIFCKPYNENLRSYHVDYALPDEISQYKDQSIFDRYLVTRTTAKKGKVVGFTTPKNAVDLAAKLQKNPIFVSKVYPAIVNIRDPTDIFSGDPIFPEKYSIERLKEIRQTIGSIAFDREYMCNVLSLEDSLFPPKLVVDSWDDTLDFSMNPYTEYCYVGVDFAVGTGKDADFFVITVIECDGAKWYIKHIEKHRGMPIPAQKQRLLEINRIFHPKSFRLDSTYYGPDVIHELRQNQVVITEQKFDHNSRRQLLLNLRQIFENKTLSIPKKRDGTCTILTDELFIELTSMVVKKTPSGLETFETNAAHDDMVMSLAMACYGATANKPYTGKIIFSG